MKIVRSIASVIAGYLIFGISAGVLFRLAQRDPHAPAPAAFMILSTVYGVVFACLGGYAAARIAQRLELLHAAILALLMATGALISLFAELGRGSAWSQIAALLFMAPAAALGGMIRLKCKESR
jgi:hypothetical protein